jgi:hypothetical protein
MGGLIYQRERGLLKVVGYLLSTEGSSTAANSSGGAGLNGDTRNAILEMTEAVARATKKETENGTVHSHPPDVGEGAFYPPSPSLIDYPFFARQGSEYIVGPVHAIITTDIGNETTGINVFYRSATDRVAQAIPGVVPIIDKQRPHYKLTMIRTMHFSGPKPRDAKNKVELGCRLPTGKLPGPTRGIRAQNVRI